MITNIRNKEENTTATYTNTTISIDNGSCIDIIITMDFAIAKINAIKLTGSNPK